ncbi:hypothetical protein JTB14_007766 [Gonioctena quinquepunctata]|nr:hypothetical protein JTB14_007766 [Gonioctena quinquepunctata]
MKHVPKKAHPQPIVPVQNRVTVFEEAEKPVEKTDPLPIQETIQAEFMQVETSNSNNEVLKPPPIVIREKNHWPKINETLKNHGIKTVENFNTRDGIRIILPSMDMFNKCTGILDQQKVQYHTFNTPQNREIRAIFKGVAEDIEPVTIAKELQDKGFDPRIVARFKNRNGQNMPIILVIVPGSQAKIKELNQICDMEVRFEHQKRKKRIGQCYNCQRLGHSAYNCKAEPVCRHCAGKHESRAHDKDDVGPNECGNCESPHESNYRGCPDFPINEKKDEKKDLPPPPRRARPPKN